MLELALCSILFWFCLHLYLVLSFLASTLIYLRTHLANSSIQCNPVLLLEVSVGDEMASWNFIYTTIKRHHLGSPLCLRKFPLNVETSISSLKCPSVPSVFPHISAIKLISLTLPTLSSHSCPHLSPVHFKSYSISPSPGDLCFLCSFPNV